MTPQEAAQALREELDEALADLGGSGARASVLAVQPPAQLGPDSSFRVAVRASRARTVEVMLPSNLAIGYLADEEAAVDEWRHWVGELWKQLTA
jgi:hypothetical protein